MSPVLSQLWERSAGKHPGHTAVISEDGALSYAEVNARANRLARLLVTRGAGPDRLVALAFPRSADMIVALLAVAKTGAAFLPVDVTYPGARVTYMLSDAAPVLLCTTLAAGVALPREPPVPRLALDSAEVTAALSTLPGTDLADDERDGPQSPENLAYVIYTSGSTGRPKGVAVTHAGLPGLAAAKVEAMRVTGDSRVLQFASPSFDAFLTEVTAAFEAGAALVVPAAGLLVSDALTAALRDNQITHAVLPPTAAATVSPRDVPGLRTLVVAGEACPPGLVERWAPYHRLINAYGPTECTVCATMTGPLAAGDEVTIGTPIPGVSAYVLDGELRPVAPGEIGELHLSGPGLARGYLGQPDLTAERFVENPFAAGTRMYRTGDLVSRRADGSMLFHGRRDGQVKLRGFRIELGEVEAVLGRHPQVAQAAAAIRTGHAATEQLAAYIVPANGTAPSASALREHMMGCLPDYMVPATYSAIDALPLTANGKLDRAALPEPGAAMGREGGDPRTPAEKALCEVFAELFGEQNVDVESDFFELGGTSILAISFIQLAQDAGLELSPRMVIENPTIKALAAVSAGER